MTAQRYVLSERAAAALRPLLQPGSAYGSRPRPVREAPTAGGGAAVPALVTSAQSGGVYAADFYERGVEAGRTGRGTVALLGSSPLQSLPANTWLLAFPVAMGAERFETVAATEATA